MTGTDTLDSKLPPEDEVSVALRSLAGLAVAFDAVQGAIERLDRLEQMALKALFRLAIHTRRTMLALAHVLLAFFMLTADLDEQVLTLIRLARSVPPCTHIHLRALLAVRRHYGHRFDQDNDSFWFLPRPMLRGAVCALS